MQVYESYIHTYTADIRRSTYHILTRSKRYVLCSICTYVHIYDFQGAGYCLVCSSICMYFQYILAYTDTVMPVGRTYVSICMYMHAFLSKIHACTSSTYMNIFPTVYLAVFLYVFSHKLALIPKRHKGRWSASRMWRDRRLELQGQLRPLWLP